MSSFDQFKAKQLVKQAFEAIQELNSMLSQPPTQPTPTPQIQPKPQQPQQSFLPPDIAHFVNVTEDEYSIVLEPKHYLQPKDYDLVNEFVKQHGGEYISKKMSRDGKPYWIIQNKGGA